REAQPVDHVVQPALQELQEGFARHALAAGRLLVITPKLALQHPVDPAQLLLLTQVDAVFSQTRAPSLAVLARRIRAAVHGALLSIALFTLQKELFSLTPAQPANGSSIPCHRSVFHLRRLRSDPPPLGRAATDVRNRSDVFDQVHFETGSLERTDSRFPARPGPLHVDLDLPDPMLHGGPCRRLRRHARRKGRPFARSLKALASGGSPRQHVALLVRDGHDGVVKRRTDMRDPDRDVLPFPPAQPCALSRPGQVVNLPKSRKATPPVASLPSICRTGALLHRPRLPAAAARRRLSGRASSRRWCGAGPCGSWRWCASAARAPEAPGGA